MCLVGERDSEDLQDFVDASLRLHIVMYHCYKTISNYGTIDLDARSIFGCSPKPFDFEVLLYPFEEQPDAPSTLEPLHRKVHAS